MRVRNHIITIITLALLSGCALAPGMKFDADPYIAEKAPDFPGTTEAGTPYEITPITAQLLNRINTPAPRASTASAVDALNRALADYDYRVGPQDVLTITVWDHPELTIPAGEFRDPAVSGTLVGPDGHIFYPYAGIIDVNGKSVTQIRNMLTARLAAYITNPQLDVRVVAFRSQRINVVGEVPKPSMLPITEVPMTILEAINQAGGITPEADLRRVTLTRGSIVRTLDIQSLYDEGNLSQNVLLQDGDVLHVPDRNDNKVYVLGEVSKPASYFMHKGKMNLAEAIGNSEGFDASSSDPSQLFVIRSEKNKPAVYHLDAKSPDALLLATQFSLQPQDVVYVSSTGLARWDRVMRQILPTIQGLWQTKVLIER
jgi:polysaccharide export outer membrane protein